MAEISTSVLTKLADYTISPVLRQFGYLYHYEDNVKHLTSQVEMLNAKRTDVKQLVQAATDNLEVIASEVNTWLANVDGIIQDKETFFEEGKTAKATCSKGTWFPNLKVRHSLSRKAKKMTPDVDNLLLVGNFSQVSCPAPPLKVRFPSTGQHIEFESRKTVVRRIMKALTNDHINPVVICGMGGIGKSTLVKEIGAKAREAGLFDEVALAVCAQVPDVSKIQEDVAEFLRLKLRASSLQARANKLSERLSGPKRVLVILDNVWSLPDLSVIGIPCDCKILVSTRNQNVFNRIETRKNFPIGILPKDDAWSLFKKMAGGSIESDLELRPIAEEVLSECDGLPIAISTLGGALREKKKPVWKDALRRLQKPFPGDSLGMENNVYKTIKLSYDYLESEVKSCFLLCCLFPESSNILLHDLVIYGLGLGLFQGIDSMEGGRDRVEALVDTLKSCYLLLDSNEKECVRMHDVVRDVALYIASNRGQDRFVIRHEVELKNWPKIGLSGQYTSTVLETTTSTHRCTDLLLLSCMNKMSMKPPATILHGMEDLQVLDISNASLLPILPSIQLMKNLQTLRLEYCYSDWTMASAVIVELRTLMILSLRGSGIEQLPDEFKNLSNLRLLDLTGCRNLKIISPGVISSFSRLEELYMWYSFQEIQVGEKRRFSQMEIQPNVNLGQLDREEVQSSGQKDEHTIISQLFSLHCLTSLDIFLPSIDKLQNSLLFHKLERFKISVGLKHDIILNPNHSENYLRLDDLDENSLVGSGVTMLLKKTDTLELKMRNLADPLNIALGTECCINLKSLRLEECDALNYLIDMTCNAPRSVFPILNLLKIEGGSRLKEICHSKLPMGSLEKLRELSLYDLPTLTHFWKMESHNECLGNLGLVEVLDIRRCQSFEEIVALDGSGHHEEVAWEFSFLNLTTLTLEDLPSFIGISKNTFFVDLPQLIRLELKNLPELGSICSNGLAPVSSSNAAIQHLYDPKVLFVFSRM